ncbi:PHP domain-containing protein [Marinospirillum sp. MEB164]|uniref:PHP domain-containing protein n=1 Tax=Marinospirillum alkalitolerans TaxID=3123374 RepID=A0ABW8PW90_9GAMM
MPLLNSQCDYHFHSTASDGQLSPSEVIQLAADRGLKEVALTDHDTFAGLEAAQQQADQLGLHLIPGMEFSCLWSGVTIHLVALWPQGLNDQAREIEVSQNQARWARAERIIERLNKAEMPITLDQVLPYSAGRVPGRPHFAACLVEQGYSKNMGQAFRRWLGAGKIADVKNAWVELEQGVACLKAAGALVSLAHPLRYKLTRSKRQRLIHAFAQAGGQAIELVSGRQDGQQTASLLKTASALGLICTWGSDFHGPGPACPAPGMYASLPEACQPISQVSACLLNA